MGAAASGSTRSAAGVAPLPGRCGGPYHPAMTSSSPPIAFAIDTAGLRALFNAQHQASRAQAEVPLALRRDRLLRIRSLLDEHGSALAQAVNADFGVRSAQLT